MRYINYLHIKLSTLSILDIVTVTRSLYHVCPAVPDWELLPVPTPSNTTDTTHTEQHTGDYRADCATVNEILVVSPLETADPLASAVKLC